MKYLISALLLFFAVELSAQTIDVRKSAYSISPEALARVKLEDRHGNLITDPNHKIAILAKRKKAVDSLHALENRSALVLTAVPLCTNGGFEEHNGGTQMLNDFAYTTGDLLNPMQCRDLDDSASSDIQQYNPGNLYEMARTVPANHIDDFIGNISGFDQYALKINHRYSSTTVSKVQGKRIKTDNETQLKFNYKAVLQSIYDTSHTDEQPFLKARVLRLNGAVVDEFCLIGDVNNCIFTQADALEAGAIILYNANWQSGLLDISSIPNNEEFIIEFVGARCGLGAHFGYAYIDDICLLHTDENFQGSIVLDPLYKICPTLPLNICGSFTVPNSGGISATVESITLQIRDSSNTPVYTSQTPVINLAAKTFCFQLLAGQLPNVVDMGYNVSATITYGGVPGGECTGTSFDSKTDDDANPGWDIWYLNCTNCDIPLNTANLMFCDTDHNGSEIFDLQDLNPLVTTTTAGITFSYFTTLDNATNATNPIVTFNNYISGSKTIFIRASKSDTCYKIIAAGLIVKNPFATISGILNVCSGSTTLTASPGIGYLWNNGATTQSISATAIGTYTVVVTDIYGCQATGTVTIPGSQVAAQPDIVLTPPSCFTATGTITVTSPATEFSYDDGVTWSNNGVMSNLPVGTYTVKIKTAMGCTSYPVTVNLIPFLSSRPDFTFGDPDYCGETGSITITTPGNSYSFDDGLTWVAQNTMDNLPSGIYNIRIKDEFDCISNYSSVVLNGEFLSPANYEIENPYCGNPGNIVITTPATEYSFDGGTTWQTSNTMANLQEGSYIIKIKNSAGCTSPNTYVYLTNLESTYPDYTVTDAGCDTYGSLTITTPGDFYSFDAGVTWTPDPTVSNLGVPQNFSIKVKKGSCESLTNSAYYYDYYLPLPVVNDYSELICDNLNDKQENVNLSDFEPMFISSPSGYQFYYYTSFAGADGAIAADNISNFSSYPLEMRENYIYVRVVDQYGCASVAKLTLTMIEAPYNNMLTSYILCEGRIIPVAAPNGFNGYLWSTGETTRTIIVNQPGNYWVTIMKNHGNVTCSTTTNFTVTLSNEPTITEITTIDWTDTDNTIEVHLSSAGIGDYEYSIDGAAYQDSNIFSGLESGVYTVYVRDRNFCGDDDQDVFLLTYPRFFTPNDDGFNDFWHIKYAKYEADLELKIYDRHGKFIRQLHGEGDGWDGKLNGHDLPATDYWFVVTRADGKMHYGHFAIKR